MKPILFNQSMVRALLDGRKTVTRRLVKAKTIEKYCDYDDYVTSVAPRDIPCIRTSEKDYYMIYAPYAVGDVLWVRETWQRDPDGFNECPPENWWYYKATAELPLTCTKWRPSIHMPKEAARIFLKVTGVRVERLQKITPKQAEKEGVGNLFMTDIAYCDIDDGYNIPLDSEYGVAKEQFAYLWDSTIKKSDIDQYGWNANPFVYVIEIERCEKPGVV